MTPRARPAILAATAVAFAAVRLAGHKEVHVGPLEVFQPHAHILVGALLFGSLAHGCRPDRTALSLGVGLTLVELACFLLGIGGRS